MWFGSEIPLKCSVEKDFSYIDFCIQGAKLFSTCSKRQFMAIIVDERGHIIGTGYNGVPRKLKHCRDGGCPRATQTGSDRNNYDNCLAIHAEANAILHSNYTDRNSCTLYVNGTPCFSCAKLICNAGITRVVFISDTKEEITAKATELFDRAGIEYDYRS